MLHAIGKGIVLAEIRQNSNLTYRIYYYDRTDNNGKKRELHIDKALDVIHFTEHIDFQKSTGIRTESGFTVTTMFFYDCFEVEKYKGEGRINEIADGRAFSTYTVTEGSCIVIYKKGSLPLSKGESVLIPANLGEFSVEGSFEALKVHVP
jgi:mannose-6-phosphate isomerase